MYKNRLLSGALMAGSTALHQYGKYRRTFNRVRRRTKRRYRFKNPSLAKKKRRTNKRYRRFTSKRKSLKKAYKNGHFKYVTSKRCEKVQFVFEIASDGTTGDAKIFDADNKWLAVTKEMLHQVQSYKNYRLRSVSWKFHNFKVRTILRSVVTEGNPPEEHTSEQILEPAWIQMRYKHNKWNDQVNPNFKVGNDNRKDEVMQTKCITNCHDKFWGIYKPKNQVSQSYEDLVSHASFRHIVKRSQTTSVNNEGSPYLSFWFSCESTLPAGFFVSDPPIQRSAKMVVDADFTCYSKWFFFSKNIEYC